VTAGHAVRAARPGDLEAIATIERASFSDPWSAASFRSLLGNAQVFFAVAEGPAGEVRGYVIEWFVVDQAEIANLAVAPEARGGGVGAALLDAALAEGRRRRMAAVYLEVRDSNARARALYAARGFAEVGRRRGYYRRPVEDALILRRTLAPAPAPG
jgi:ribosomal-protein-alanine N-acetyltransferase